MFDFESLIGYKKDEAVKILSENGYKNIEFIINSKRNDLCDALLVCKALLHNEKVILVLGEFYLNIEE